MKTISEFPTTLPDHTQLPESDGTFVKNFQEHPQSILLTESIEPILQQLHPDGQYAIGQSGGIYWRLKEPPERGAEAPDGSTSATCHPPSTVKCDAPTCCGRKHFPTYCLRICLWQRSSRTRSYSLRRQILGVRTSDSHSFLRHLRSHQSQRRSLSSGRGTLQFVARQRSRTLSHSATGSRTRHLAGALQKRRTALAAVVG